MSKNIFCLMVLTGMLALTGCQTIHGAATGFNQDIQNISNPDANGWNAAQKADAWMRKNLW